MAALQAGTKGTVMTEYHGFKFSDRLTAIKLICARDAAAVLDKAHDMAGESVTAAGGGMANSPLASSKSTSGKSARRSRSPSPGAPEDKSAVPVKPSPNRSSKLPKRKASSISTASLSQPNGTEEVAFATKCLATAQAQSESCSDHLTAAALAYNTEYFRTSQAPNISEHRKTQASRSFRKHRRMHSF